MNTELYNEIIVLIVEIAGLSQCLFTDEGIKQLADRAEIILELINQG